MSEIKGSICFLLIFSYNYYLHEARRLLCSLNSHYFQRYMNFGSPPGTLQHLFLRKDLVLCPKNNLSSEAYLVKVMDRRLQIIGLEYLYELGRVAQKTGLNPRVLCIESIEIGGTIRKATSYAKTLKSLQGAFSFLGEVNQVREVCFKIAGKSNTLFGQELGTIFSLLMPQLSCYELKLKGDVGNKTPCIVRGCDIPVHIPALTLASFSNFEETISSYLSSRKSIEKLVLMKDKMSLAEETKLFQAIGEHDNVE